MSGLGGLGARSLELVLHVMTTVRDVGPRDATSGEPERGDQDESRAAIRKAVRQDFLLRKRQEADRVSPFDVVPAGALVEARTLQGHGQPKAGDRVRQPEHRPMLTQGGGEGDWILPP
jgi:hypothetical protein